MKREAFIGIGLLAALYLYRQHQLKVAGYVCTGTGAKRKCSPPFTMVL